ncbi:ATP-binding protein [Weissella cibaria]|uniref:ATP-binding protein n=1 Tax=Weissella cibaria TaxID=137591 RepID=A0A9Q8JIE1_9LACO|nr:ATP-binding protein [Weissella cibaria]TVV27501.1 ATP-binding protein [Weissella cibaria]TVV40693.1 ATP-binding protein [Weissella cibaria]
MKLISFQMQNFRGYHDAKINIEDFTTIVGRNDIGKSTILEALDIFFGNSKMDQSDRNVYYPDEDVKLTAVFSDVPDIIQIETIPTTFRDEYLLDINGNLTIQKIFSGSAATLNSKDYILAYHPLDDSVINIHTQKHSDLKINYKELIDNNNIDKRKSAPIRQAALKNATQLDAGMGEIPIALNSKYEFTKEISAEISKYMPLYQLFKSDRKNTDKDSEIQDPIKAMVKSALTQNDVATKLNKAFLEVQKNIENLTDRTLEMLKTMDSGLANELYSEANEPDWSKVFGFGLKTDSGISLNKRGSGVRRLILLNFFRAEAKRLLEESSDQKGIIYAFEEPETAQHPNNQKILIQSFLDMSTSDNVQVIITTHSPQIAQTVPSEGVRLINSCQDIQSGTEAVKGAAEELGIFPDIDVYNKSYDKMLILEGPDDVEFFEHLFTELDKLSNVLVIPAGGAGSVKDFVNYNFVTTLGIRKVFAIFDGDQAGNKGISSIEKSGTAIQTIQLNKSTLEFYLPYTFVKKRLSNSSNALNESINADSWDIGNDDLKLNKNQKAFLKTGHAYKAFNVKDLSQTSQTELNDIVLQIEEGR